jgi:hypothetical protein
MKGLPTIKEVEMADKEQLARWYRFLPSGKTAADQKIMKRISERFEKLGGMTTELNKKLECTGATISCYIFHCHATSLM